ncbi:MAG: TspO/MBR family protein [Sphingomicrobium sp.]
MDEAHNEARPWGKIAIFTVPVIVLLGSASGWISNSGFGNNWFDALVKPGLMPPGWAFGLVWPILYAMMGLALAMILALPPSAKKRNALMFFFVQLGLNLAWSPVFFALHDMRAAQVIIFLMIVFAAGSAGQFYRLQKAAGMLLIPYLAWLVFASMLNTAILNLNPGQNVSLLG